MLLIIFNVADSIKYVAVKNILSIKYVAVGIKYVAVDFFFLPLSVDFVSLRNVFFFWDMFLISNVKKEYKKQAKKSIFGYFGIETLRGFKKY